MSVDLGPAAERMSRIVENVGDDQLGAPTPCPKYTVADLLDHIHGLSGAFTDAAKKENLDKLSSAPPPGDASHLSDDWRTSIPRRVATLSDAWRDPDAWTGMTKAGGIEMPGEIAGMVAINELIVHGWDLAKATGQPGDADDDSVAAARGFVDQFASPEGSGDAFGPAFYLPDDAPAIDRLVGLTGRDPSWSPR